MSRFAWKLVLSWRCCAQQECVLKLVCFTVVGCHLRCCHVELAASWEGLPCYAYPCPCFVPCGTIWWPFRWWWRVQPRLLETIWLEKRWLEKWWLEERRLEKRRLEKRRLEKRILARLEKKTEWLVQPGQRSFFLAQKGTHRSRIRSVAQRSAEGVFATDGGEKGNNTSSSSSSSSNSYRDTFGAGCPQDVACQETCWAGEEWGEEKANPKTTHAVYGFEFHPAECLGSYAASKGYKSVCLGQLSMWSWKFWWEHGDLQRCSSYVSETRWTSSAKLSSMAWKNKMVLRLELRLQSLRDGLQMLIWSQDRDQQVQDECLVYAKMVWYHYEEQLIQYMKMPNLPMLPDGNACVPSPGLDSPPKEDIFRVLQVTQSEWQQVRHQFVEAKVPSLWKELKKNKPNKISDLLHDEKLPGEPEVALEEPPKKFQQPTCKKRAKAKGVKISFAMRSKRSLLKKRKWNSMMQGWDPRMSLYCLWRKICDKGWKNWNMFS